MWSSPAASPLKVRELFEASPEVSNNTTPRQNPVPVDTLKARSVDAKGKLIENELRQQFGEEVRWHKKQADHLTVELETARLKRKEMEAEFAKTKADLEHQLKEALAENEDLLAGGGQRGTLAELEASRKQAAGLQKELDALQARHADGIEARRIHTTELRDARERLQAAQTEAASLRDALKRGQAEAQQSAQKLSSAVERAEQAEKEAGSKTELTTRVAALEAQAQQSVAELEQIKSKAEHAEAEAASTKADLAATIERLEARASKAEDEAACAKESMSVAQAGAASAESSRKAAAEEVQTLQLQVKELNAQKLSAKQEHARTMQQSEQELKKSKAEAANLRAKVEGLARQLAAAEGSQEGAKAAAAASQELRRCQSELMELQAEYNRAVFEMAKARAEHSEMLGFVTKAKAEVASTSQRLAATQLALAECVHVILLSSSDDNAPAVSDLDQNDQSSRSTTGNGSKKASAPHKANASSIATKGSSMHTQLERVRKILMDAEEQRRAAEVM